MLRNAFQILPAVTLTVFSTCCFAQQTPRVDFRPGEVIVGYQTEADRRASEGKLTTATVINSFSLLGGQKTKKVEIKPFSNTAVVVKFTLPSGQNAFASDDREFQRRLIDDLANQIKKADPKVKYAFPHYLMGIPDQKPISEAQMKKRLSAMKVNAAPSTGFPDDLQFAAGLQWNLQALPRGMNAIGAWKVTTGDRKIVVAVVDSGILRSHPDVVGSGNLLPGYNFVKDDPGGRNDDTSDRSRIFHGSNVASIVGAVATNNKLHLAGVNWAVSVVPVRVTNLADEASDQDIADGILWAAGLPVDGVPKNENAADVINLSLGEAVACSKIDVIRDALDKARAAGAVIVAAAGNNKGDVAGFSPAGCPGVISVAAADINGRLSSYSNFGNVSIVAPGGDGEASVLGISDKGIGGLSGTSQAAPHVAAAIALALSNHEQWRRKPDLIAAAIRDTAVPMPTGACPRPCGPGQLDAVRLLDYQPASARPPAVAAASAAPSAPAAAVRQTAMKTASSSDLSGRWLTAEGAMLVIKGEEWLHPSKGEATLSRSGQNELIVRYPQQTGVTCSYRATLIEDGAALRLDPTNAAQPEEFCPSGRLSSSSSTAAAQSKTATKVASDASSPAIVGRWLMAGSGGILVIEQGRWAHPTKGAADLASAAGDQLIVQYPQPANAKCSYRVAVLDAGKSLELVSTNALQSEDFCPAGRLTAVP